MAHGAGRPQGEKGRPPRCNPEFLPGRRSKASAPSAATRGPTALRHEHTALGAGERVLAERVPLCEQVVLFNIATAATVAIGILTLYVALFVPTFAGAGLKSENASAITLIHRQSPLQVEELQVLGLPVRVGIGEEARS